ILHRANDAPRRISRKAAPPGCGAASWGPSKREQGFCRPDRAHREPHPPRTRPQGPARCRPRRALRRGDARPSPCQTSTEFLYPSPFCDVQSGRQDGASARTFAFTEHGALMAATVLNSPRAVETSVYVVRAFIRLRQFLATHKDLARRLEEHEKKRG